MVCRNGLQIVKIFLSVWRAVEKKNVLKLFTASSGTFHILPSYRTSFGWPRSLFAGYRNWLPACKLAKLFLFKELWEYSPLPPFPPHPWNPSQLMLSETVVTVSEIPSAPVAGYWSQPLCVKVDLRVVMKRPQKKNCLVKGRSKLEKKKLYWPLCAVCWIANSCHSFERELFICFAVSWFLPLSNYPQVTTTERLFGNSQLVFRKREKYSQNLPGLRKKFWQPGFWGCIWVSWSFKEWENFASADCFWHAVLNNSRC